MRATLRLSSPAWFAQPRTTSSICRRVDVCPLDRRPHGVRREIVGPHAGEGAAVTPYGRANG